MVIDAHRLTSTRVRRPFGARPRWTSATDSTRRTLFDHDEPYECQVDEVEATIDVARECGHAVVEGACGTGKTLLLGKRGRHRRPL